MILLLRFRKSQLSSISCLERSLASFSYRGAFSSLRTNQVFCCIPQILMNYQFLQNPLQINLKQSKNLKFIEICFLNPLAMAKLQLHHVVGKGAYSSVYSASKINGRQIVVKLTSQHHQALSNEKNVLEMLQKYEGFPKIYGFKQEKNVSWLAMERLGSTLADHLTNLHTLPRQLTIKIGIQLINRLEVLHSEGYLHLDIKPSNIIFSVDQNHLYLIDFGFSTRIHTKSDNESFKGNLFYSSTNRMKCGQFNIFDDIQSFFYLIYRLLGGALPWNQVQGFPSLQMFLCIKRKKQSICWKNLMYGQWMERAMRVVQDRKKRGIYKKVKKMLNEIPK